MLRVPDTCAYLGGISRTTLWRWTNEGKVPKPIYINKQIFYPMDGLEECVKNLIEQGGV